MSMDLPILRDFHQALRSLIRAPRFSLVVIIVLGVGIGANLTIFSAAYSSLWRPLPVPQARALVRVEQTPALLYRDYAAYRDQNSSLSGLAFFAPATATLRVGSSESLVQGQAISGNFFQLLRVPFELGRAIAPADEESDAPAVVVLGYRVWNNRFGGDPNILNRDVAVNGQPATIIGIAPESFSGVDALLGYDFWMPVEGTPSLYPNRPLEDVSGGMIGRLLDDATITRAQANMEVIASQGHEFSSPERRVTVGRARILSPVLVDGLRPTGILLIGLVALMLFAACINLMSLFASRGQDSHREIAVRAALGGSRWRIIRPSVIEALVLSSAGGTFAVIMNLYATQWLSQLRLPGGPQVFGALDLRMDWMIGSFALAVSLFACFACGVLPVLRMTSHSLLPSLTELTSGNPRQAKMSIASLIVQFALSTMLVMVGANAIERLRSVNDIDYGFETEGLFVLRGHVNPTNAAGFDDGRNASTVAKAIRDVHGVAASAVEVVPLSFASRTARVRSDRLESGEATVASYNRISPGHFNTLGIELIAGRDFSDSDQTEGALVAIVNETAAATLWPDDSPLGQRLIRQVEQENVSLEVVGIAPDVTYASPWEAVTAFVYMPLPVSDDASLLVRADTSDHATSLVVSAIDRDLPLNRMMAPTPIESGVDLSLFGVRGISVVASLAGALAAIIAAVGVFGIVSYLVRRRRLEFAICSVLGATVPQLVWRATRRVIVCAIGGVLAGGVTAAFLIFVFSRLVVLNVPGSSGPLSLVVGVFAIAALGVTSAILPLRHSVLENPMEALRRRTE